MIKFTDFIESDDSNAGFIKARDKIRKQVEDYGNFRRELTAMIEKAYDLQKQAAALESQKVVKTGVLALMQKVVKDLRKAAEQE